MKLGKYFSCQHEHHFTLDLNGGLLCVSCRSSISRLVRTNNFFLSLSLNNKMALEVLYSIVPPALDLAKGGWRAVG